VENNEHVPTVDEKFASGEAKSTVLIVGEGEDMEFRKKLLDALRQAGAEEVDLTEDDSNLGLGLS
jgi:hypothetical protein